MPKQPKNLQPSRTSGQVSVDVPMYFNRLLPSWGSPSWLEGSRWRTFVRNQPIAMICRESLVSQFLSLDFQVISRDSNMRDELKDEIKYYTEGLEHSFGVDYSNHVEWAIQDMLDLPFGTACEIVRKTDSPTGKVFEIVLMDGTTLYPTLNSDYPVAQYAPSVSVDSVYFPYYSVSRAYISARPEILRTGWGMAPPEKIYLSMEMLYRGDSYYAQLLVDTPTAGILDLGDMERETAKGWVQDFRGLLNGVDPFKIPVLYEHTTAANYIPFGKPPTDLMFDSITLKLASIIAAGYGLSLSDIGMGASSNGGETMAGSIRQERKSRKTGIGAIKRKMASYFNRIIPDYLEFKLVDYDDELNMSMARSRLANSQAFSAFIDRGIFSPAECRLQALTDGLFTVPISESVPEDLLPINAPLGLTDSRKKLVGDPVPASQGGYADNVQKSETDTFFSPVLVHMKDLISKVFSKILANSNETKLRGLVQVTVKNLYPSVYKAVNNLSDSELHIWRNWYSDMLLLEDMDSSFEIIRNSIVGIDAEMQSVLDDDPDWWKVVDAGVILMMIDMFENEYLATVRKTNNNMSFFVQDNGLFAPTTDLMYSLSNSTVKDWIRQKAEQSAILLNEGSAFYMKRVLMSSVKNVLTNSYWSNAMLEGKLSVEGLINNQSFIDQVLSSYRNDLGAIISKRSVAVSEFELSGIIGQATVDTYRKSGLTKKFWKNLGLAPCKVCQDNQREGWVDLGFRYKTVFPGVLSYAPPAHPNIEYCALLFDEQDLLNTVKNGKFSVWTGD